MITFLVTAIMFLVRIKEDGGQCVLSPQRFLVEKLQESNGGYAECSCTILANNSIYPTLIVFNDTSSVLSNGNDNNQMSNDPQNTADWSRLHIKP